MSVILSNNIIQPLNYNELDDDNLVSKQNTIDIINNMFFLSYLCGLILTSVVLLLLCLICSLYYVYKIIFR